MWLAPEVDRHIHLEQLLVDVGDNARSFSGFWRTGLMSWYGGSFSRPFLAQVNTLQREGGNWLCCGWIAAQRWRLWHVILQMLSMRIQNRKYHRDSQERSASEIELPLGQVTLNLRLGAVTSPGWGPLIKWIPLYNRPPGIRIRTTAGLQGIQLS